MNDHDYEPEPPRQSSSAPSEQAALSTTTPESGDTASTVALSIDREVPLARRLADQCAESPGSEGHGGSRELPGIDEGWKEEVFQNVVLPNLRGHERARMESVALSRIPHSLRRQLTTRHSTRAGSKE